MKELVSPKQVAQAIGVSEASLKRWCDKGLLPTIRTAGGHRRLPINGVVGFLRTTGHPLVKPELLGLPAGAGRGSSGAQRLVEGVTAALECGDEEQVRRSVLNLYVGGLPASGIGDDILAPAFSAIGTHWQHGAVEVYQERRACEICLRVLHELRAILTGPATDAPQAICATFGVDRYALPVAMVEIALRDGGWRAESYGAGNPAATLCAAIAEHRPRVFCLSVSHIESVEDFLQDYTQVYEAAQQQGTALVVGGRAMVEAVRREISYAAYCDTLRHLSDFAATLYRPPGGEA